MDEAPPLIPGGKSCPGAPIRVAAGLVFRQGKLLITQRHAHAHQGGLWEFPGGKLEHGETFEACLSRELKEELGIEVEVEEQVESLTHAYPEKTVLLNFYRCLWKRYEPKALDCADWRWIRVGELDSFSFPAADARLLGLLRTRPELWQTC